MMGVFWITTFFYALLLFVPSKAVALVVSILFLGVLFVVFRNIPSVLVLGYLAFVPLPVGKFFPIPLVSAAQLQFLLGRPFGISADILVTPQELLVIVMAIMLVWRMAQTGHMFWPDTYVGWTLVVLPIAFVASAMFGSMLPGVSTLHALFYLAPFILYTFITRIRHRLDYRAVLGIVLAGILLEGTVLLAQLANGGALGLIVERNPYYTPIDVSTEATNLLRLGGTFTHANNLAQFLLFAIPVTLPMLFAPGASMSPWVVVPFFVGWTTFMLTQSRSAWLALGVALVWCVAHARRFRIRLVVHRPLRRVGWVVLGALLVVAVLVGYPRAASTLRTMEPYGSGATRLLLLREAGALIREYPVFGVGIPLDVYASYLRSQALGKELVSYFPEPVHNGFLELVVQTGIVGLVPYVLVLIGLWQALFFRRAMESQSRKLYRMGVAAALLGQMVNAQLQPLLPDLSTLVLLITLLT